MSELAGAVVAVAARPAVAMGGGDGTVPVCAHSTESRCGKWQSISVKPTSIVIQGGFGGRTPRVAQSLEVQMGDTEWRFVHFTKQSRWLIHGCAGPRAGKGDLSAVKVIDEIRHKFFGTESSAVADSTVGECAVAEDADAGDVDPMDQLDEVRAEDKPKPKAPVRRRSMAPVKLSMPKRPACTGQACDETQTIYVILRPCGNRQLYIRMDCVDWLVAYAADEHHFQGVVRAPPVSSPVTAVADYRVEWEFNHCFWACEILVGSDAGLTKQFSPSGISTKQWRDLRALGLADGWFSRSTMAKRKRAAKGLAELWCIATLKGDRQSFEASWLGGADARGQLEDNKSEMGGQEPSPKRQRSLCDWTTAAVATDCGGGRSPSAVAARTVKAEPKVKAEPSANIAKSHAIVDDTFIEISDGE